MANANQNQQGKKLPTHAQVVVIGGGVIGCSTAFHLAKLGWKDVLLLEQNQLTAGTTWHAAGLVEAGGFFDETTIEIAKYTLKLYAGLEKETGLATGFNPVGMLEIVCTPSRLEGLRRISAFCRYFDVDMQEISPARATRAPVSCGRSPPEGTVIGSNWSTRRALIFVPSGA